MSEIMHQCSLTPGQRVQQQPPVGLEKTTLTDSDGLPRSQICRRLMCSAARLSEDRSTSVLMRDKKRAEPVSAVQLHFLLISAEFMKLTPTVREQREKTTFPSIIRNDVSLKALMNMKMNFI